MGKTGLSHPSQIPFYRIMLSAGGITFLTQGLALLRQLLIVGYFGLGRSLDLYSTAYAIAAVTVFAFNTVLENTCMSLLVKVRDEHGPMVAVRTAQRYILFGVFSGVMGGLAFVIIAPLLGFVYAAGFSAEEHEQLLWLLAYFLPWAIISPIYFVTAGCLKALLFYRSVFWAEFLAVTCSIGLLVVMHGDVHDVPLAYSGGYLFAATFLVIKLFRLRSTAAPTEIPVRVLIKRIGAYLASNQTSIPLAMADRFWQSFLPAGGIASLALIQQLAMNLGGLLAFRDAYLVPLVSEKNRLAKLRRLLLGIAHVTLPVTIFVAVFSSEIMSVLLMFGKVSASDIKMTATLLAISMFGLFFTTVSTPCWRLLQSLGSYQAVTIFYLGSGASTLLLGFLLIRIWDLGPTGMLIISAINVVAGCIYLGIIYARQGLRIESTDFANLGKSLLSSFLAACIALLLTRFVSGAITTVAVAGAIYATLIGAYVFWNRSMLTKLVRGHSSAETD